MVLTSKPITMTFNIHLYQATNLLNVRRCLHGIVYWWLKHEDQTFSTVESELWRNAEPSAF